MCVTVHRTSRHSRNENLVETNTDWSTCCNQFLITTVFISARSCRDFILS